MKGAIVALAVLGAFTAMALGLALAAPDLALVPDTATTTTTPPKCIVIQGWIDDQSDKGSISGVSVQDCSSPGTALAVDTNPGTPYVSVLISASGAKFQHDYEAGSSTFKIEIPVKSTGICGQANVAITLYDPDTGSYGIPTTKKIAEWTGQLTLPCP